MRGRRKNARGKRSASCILKLTQQQKPVILGNEYIVIKEGYFALSLPHLSLFVCSPVYRRPLPSEKIGASSSQKGGGGSTQAICVPFCLGFVCTYLDVLKLSVFEKYAFTRCVFKSFSPKRLNAKYHSIPYRACAV